MCRYAQAGSKLTDFSPPLSASTAQVLYFLVFGCSFPLNNLGLSVHTGFSSTCVMPRSEIRAVGQAGSRYHRPEPKAHLSLFASYDKSSWNSFVHTCGIIKQSYGLSRLWLGRGKVWEEGGGREGTNLDPTKAIIISLFVFFYFFFIFFHFYNLCG